MPNISLDKKDDIINDYNNGMSSPKLAEKYGVSKPTILKWLRKWGVDTSVKSHVDYKNSKYSFNEHWLDELDCQEKLYFLGFFYADGNTSNGYDSNYYVRMKLQSRDKEILDKFTELFESNRPLLYESHYSPDLKSEQSTYTFTITSKYFWNRMIELGCPANKTLILRFPAFVFDKYINSFIRGIFDGDGNITLRQENTLANIRICGTEDICKGVYREVLKHTGVKGVYYKDRTGKQMWLYDIANQRDVKKFIEWIYQDCNICLKRKQEKAVLFLNTRDFNKETQMEIGKRVRQHSEEIIQQFKDGISQNQIGRNFNCSAFTIHRVLQENNII